MVLRVYPDIQQKKPFRFMNMWCNHQALTDIVGQIWLQPIVGCDMYRVMQRLKGVKVELKKMNREGFGDVEANLIKARQELMEVQEEMHNDVGNCVLATRKS